MFNEVFGLPDNDLNYYAIEIGPQVRFVTLNTETSTAGDQAKWLDRELVASRPKYRWWVAQYHRPAFPAVKKPSAALQSWVPLFERYNVDLVCEADGHNIKRTVPIRGGKQDKSGVVYIGERGLGVPQPTPKDDRLKTIAGSSDRPAWPTKAIMCSCSRSKRKSSRVSAYCLAVKRETILCGLCGERPSD